MTACAKYIIDVKPSTYKVICDCTVSEDTSWKSKKDIAFGKLELINE